jgi:DNA-binding PadR family transcriptional regulator
MRSSSSSSSFDLREAVENLRNAFTPRDSSRSAGASHGDLRAAILSALEHDAKNGHQVMQAIDAASGGMWMPSASQVYPMLQQLTDEGLLSVQHDGERSVYSLTDAGREAAAAHAHAHATAGESSSRSSWNVSDITDRMSEAADRMSGRMNDHWSERTSAVPRAGAKLAQAAAQVTQSGTREQQERAAALLDQTRKALYAILAED